MHTVKRLLYVVFIASVLSVLRIVFFYWLLLSSKRKIRSAEYRTREFGRNQIFYLRDILLWSPHWMLSTNSLPARSLFGVIETAAEYANEFQDAPELKIIKWKNDLCESIGLGHLLEFQEEEFVQVSKPILTKSPVSTKPKAIEAEDEERVIVPVKLTNDFDIHS
jgi:hypothetical protein